MKLPQHTVQFSAMTASIHQSRLNPKELDITSVIYSRVDAEAFCEELVLFSFDDFVSE